MEKVDLCLVGGSAGSLRPFRSLLEDMKDSSLNNTAVVLFQHLASDATSMMKSIMEGATTWRVENIESTLTIHPKTIYLNSPGVEIYLKNGRIEPRGPIEKSVSPISDFWQTAIDDFESYRTVTAIVLSGGGTDASVGAKNLYECGALVLVQTPEEAEIPSMPRQVLERGCFHYECHSTEMAAVIESYEKDSNFIQSIMPMGDVQQTNKDVREVLQKTFQDVKLNVEWYRLETLVRGLKNRKEALKYQEHQEYFDLLLESESERRDLVGALLISYTEFFRDLEYFEYLRDIFLRAVEDPEKEEVRLWSVGCSSGEEAYSLAMLICDLCERKNIKKEIKLFASDVNDNHIVHCRKGEYHIDKLEKIPTQYHKYLTIHDKSFVINDQVRKVITFATHNCLTTHGFPRMDMVSCRNVMIYFKRLFQDRILESLASCLNIGGHLFLGMSESLPQDMLPYFNDIKVPGSLYQKEKTYLGKLELLKTVEDMATRGTSVVLDRTSREKVGIGRDATQELLSRFIKRGVLMDKDGKLVGFQGDPSPVFPSMSLELYVHEMALPELSSLMVTGPQVASRSNNPIVYDDIDCPGAGHVVKLIFSSVGVEKDFIFLEIETAGDRSVKKERKEIPQEKRDYISDLENEILSLKGDASQKEQKFVTLNEEFRLQNEELISGNEELQASNEEIKSINTELNIVNKELESSYRLSTKEITKSQGVLSQMNASYYIFDSQSRLVDMSTRPEFGLTRRDIKRPLKEVFNKTQLEQLEPFLEKIPSSGIVELEDNYYFLEITSGNEAILMLFQKFKGLLKDIYKKGQNSDEILPILSQIYKGNKNLVAQLSTGKKISDFEQEISSFGNNLTKIQKVLSADFGQWEETDLYSLMDAAVEKVLGLEVSSVRGNTFKSLRDQSIPSYLGPKERLEEIFFHFLHNSSQFNQRVEGSIKISNIEKGTNKDRVTVIIEDNGIGIREKELNNINDTLSRDEGPKFSNLRNIQKYLKYFLDGDIKIVSDGLKNVSVSITFELERKD